jgi:phosphatidylserine/phosphatidylglycerophosphate/cardiolipin synthase-like enzyme
VTKRNTRNRSSQQPLPIGVWVIIAATVLGLYVLQITGAVDLGLFDVEPTPQAYELQPANAIQVYFTQPRYPDDPESRGSGLDTILASDIAQALASVDVAAYELDLETVGQALVNAHQRGVAVRVLTDSDNVDERAVRQLVRAGIPVSEDNRSALMHNKFVIIDESVIWTGSWNLTENGTYRNDNNAVRVFSHRLAENYRAEFEEMFVERRFGPSSPADTPHPTLRIRNQDSSEDLLVETYFAPEDAVADRILAAVEGAQESIRFMAFSFTDDRLGEAIKQQAKAGLAVQGVFETRGAESEYGEYGRMSRARPPLDILLDGNPYSMHHKVVILDDETVILGSFNFTDSANESNDENLLIVHDLDVAARYRAEFERVYAQAAQASSD